MIGGFVLTGAAVAVIGYGLICDLARSIRNHYSTPTRRTTTLNVGDGIARTKIEMEVLFQRPCAPDPKRRIA